MGHFDPLSITSISNYSTPESLQCCSGQTHPMWWIRSRFVIRFPFCRVDLAVSLSKALNTRTRVAPEVHQGHTRVAPGALQRQHQIFQSSAFVPFSLCVSLFWSRLDLCYLSVTTTRPTTCMHLTISNRIRTRFHLNVINVEISRHVVGSLLTRLFFFFFGLIYSR